MRRVVDWNLLFEKAAGFVKRLARKPATLVLVLVCVALLVGGMGFSTAFHARSRMTEFGMKDIGELATQSGYFTVVNVMDDNLKLWGWDVPLTQSKYIFSYDGVVKAGLDFSQLDYEVNSVKKEVTVFLPEIRLLSVEIQEDSLEIYDESHNIFTPLGLSDVQESRLSMLDEIKTKALENGLLDQAAENAKTLIRGFLSGQYSPEEYRFVFSEG